VWQALFELLLCSAPASLARGGLTPNDSRALFRLELRTRRSMRAPADEWQCDPSNATSWIASQRWAWRHGSRC
jgi:hypothetical protein